MRSWENRSTEIANLLNPAFLSVIIYQSIKGYTTEMSKSKCPYVLPFLVTSLVLHKKTRDSLPRQVTSTLSTWLTQIRGSHAKLNYSERTKELVPFVKEAIMFGLNNQLLLLADNGSLDTNQNISFPTHSNNSITNEVANCYKRAYFCGRWIARAGKIETVMALLGVKP
ncbi:MAG: hypothetical protein GY797_20230 [Deltaproteobacteria bacterium]|nr:hypothetical protein [Deltaproteobacteria bacterium]